MSVVLQVTPHDPLVARDGRPFGAGQGTRMRGLPWPLPSVVAGSFRTALLKSSDGLDFSGNIPQRLMQINVAGVFPVHGGELYLPAPNDAVAEPNADGKGIKVVHRVAPQPFTGGCDLPEENLLPVMLSETQAHDDFKPADSPAWWPISKYAEWLLGKDVCFDSTFLRSPLQSMRDHVALDADRGAAEEGKIFASSNLNVTHLPRFGAKLDDDNIPFKERFVEVSLSARIAMPVSETELKLDNNFNIWHPLGGERRLVHWQTLASEVWKCPEVIRNGIANQRTTAIRMVLATPAIFKHGWKPGWLTNGLEGELKGVKLKLVGVSNGRWKAVSGWSLAPPLGPKPIRRMVPAGSVYFFEVLQGDASQLADKMWLQSVSDNEQEQRDGFGLATWGTW